MPFTKSIPDSAQTKFMNSEVEVFCDNRQTFSSVDTKYSSLEELVSQVAINDQGKKGDRVYNAPKAFYNKSK